MRKSSDSQKESEDEQDGGWQWGEVGNQRTEGKSLRALLVCKIIYPFVVDEFLLNAGVALPDLVMMRIQASASITETVTGVRRTFNLF